MAKTQANTVPRIEDIPGLIAADPAVKAAQERLDRAVAEHDAARAEADELLAAIGGRETARRQTGPQALLHGGDIADGDLSSLRQQHAKAAARAAAWQQAAELGKRELDNAQAPVAYRVLEQFAGLRRERLLKYLEAIAAVAALIADERAFISKLRDAGLPALPEFFLGTLVDAFDHTSGLAQFCNDLTSKKLIAQDDVPTVLRNAWASSEAEVVREESRRLAAVAEFERLARAKLAAERTRREKEQARRLSAW
jgi:hypothetical protein